MAKLSDNTMRELDDILNETASYGDRLNEFLKLKTTNKPQNRNTPFVLGGPNYSFNIGDLDVDMVKLSPKPQPKDAEQNSKEIKKNALRDSTNNANAAILQSPPVVEAPASPLFSENAQPSRSLSNSPKRNLRRSGGIPGSDRLRRVAIQRRSRSCGRDLLKEFNDAEPRTSKTQQQEETSSASNTMTFIPAISSTPAIDAQAKNSTAASAVAVATEQEEQVGASFKYSQRREEVPLSSTSQRSANANNGTVQRTYTVEMGPEPGQLLLSPSRKSSNSRLHLSPSHSVHNASHRLSNRTYASSPARAEILAPDTPPRVLAHSLRESEFTVPETQPQDGIQQQVLQTMTNSPKAAPFVVIPLACLSPKTKNSIKDQQQSAATSSSPGAALSAAVPKVASRSMQTSDNSRNMKYLNALLTDDDSDDQRELNSLLPLNLAPPGGNTTRQSRLRKRGQRAKSPNMLLDLQTSRTQRQKPLKKSVLNKPSKQPINGEEFAEELARMSNYEILDLRKRNSLGKLNPLNGRRQNPKEQQIIEEHIKWELMRRDRDNVSPKKSLSKVPLPTASPCAKSPIPKSTTAISKPTMNPSFRMSPAAAPAGFRDKSMRERRRLRRESEKNALGNDSLDSSPENAYQQISKQQRKRSRRRKSSMSEDEILAICTPPAQFRRSKHKEKEEPSTTSLAEPPADFRRSKSIVQLPDSPTQLRKSKSRHTEDSNKTVVAEPPPDFRYRSSQGIEDDHSDEDALPQPTAQLRKSRHLEQLETNETVLPEPPEQFRKSKSRHVEQEPEGVSNTSPLQESRIYRSRLRIRDNESPPLEQSVQLRKSKSRHLEQLDIIESNETVISENPQQMRKSKSRRFEQLDIVESNGHCERSKITHLEMHTEEVSALPKPPEEFKRHKSRLRIEDDDSDEAAPPMPASPVQLQKAKSNDKKKNHISIQRIEDDDSDEAAMPDPPAQLQKSKAKHLEHNNIVESYETVLADPPEQFRKSKSRQRHVTIVEPDTSDMENTQPQLQRSMTRQEEQLVAPKSNIDELEMPSLQCVDEVRLNDVDTGPETIINSPPKTFNNNTSHISSREEVMPPSLPIETDLDEMPSTSNNTSSNRRRGKKKKASNNDVKIKKNEAAVSRAKKSRREEAKKELENLAINLPNRTLPPSEHDDDQNTTGVRKSKRGHIPLCNTWVHTVDDPFFFLYKKPYQRKVYPLPPKPKKKLQINNTDLFVDKPPLASSTPSNEATNVTSSDTKADKHNRKRKQLTGITLSSIAEQPEERSMEFMRQEQLQEQPIETKTSKRGRPKKNDPISSKDIVTPKTLVSSATQTDFEPALECHPTVQSTNSSQNDGFPLNWLRNLNDQPIPKDDSTHQEFKSMKISRASNLQYSKISGLDYAFYGGSDNTIGFIRFQPFQVRGINKAKSKLQFVVFYGEFEIETNDLETKTDPKKSELLPTRDTISAGDFLLIKIGTQYNIKNCLDAEGVLLINRCS